MPTGSNVVGASRAQCRLDKAGPAWPLGLKAFRDPEWQKVKAESEKDGSLVAKVRESVYMTPTDSSSLK
jgi:hypothetical protein